jgi:GMP synthase-like glutamine amidotransferase
MKLGILETGSPPADLQRSFSSYSGMFQRLLGPAYRYSTFDVRQGELPAASDDCDAYLITGSAAGVYDGLDWIDPLKSFVKNISGRAALVGICFGHQLMAEVFGGRVIKSPKGWGIGLHDYAVWHRADWMDDAPAIAIPASHQDQVVELPQGATVLAGSAFAPFGALEYPGRRAISFQCHPEFTPEYAAALIDLRRGTRYDPAFADAALASLRKPNDRERVATWLRQFLATVVPQR